MVDEYRKTEPMPSIDKLIANARENNPEIAELLDATKKKFGDSKPDASELREFMDDFRWGKLKNNPPLPPWIELPEIGRDSVGWRMGRGEDQLNKVFLYLNRATEEQRVKYIKSFPAPENWYPFYEEDEI